VIESFGGGAGVVVELRVLTYNVRALRDDRAAVVRVVRALDPDVVCVQETPRFLRWRAKVARLARECGLVYATGGRTAAGNAVLTHLRVDVRNPRDIKLSKRRGLHQRGLAVVDVAKSGAHLVVASAHFSLDARERAEHVHEILGHPSRGDGIPVVLAGDLNEPPSGPTWKTLRERFRDAYADEPTGGEMTFSARNPRRRIDGVLVDEGVEVVSCGVPEHVDGLDPSSIEAASDHRPVLAVLRLPAT
jgi:endonuclease/exonuclease/phosphatase family metal-dependent hydrolase